MRTLIVLQCVHLILKRSHTSLNTIGHSIISSLITKPWSNRLLEPNSPTLNRNPRPPGKHSIQDIILNHMTSFLIQGHVLPSTVSKLNFIQEWVKLEEKKDWEMESVFKLEMEGLYLQSKHFPTSRNSSFLVGRSWVLFGCLLFLRL